MSNKHCSPQPVDCSQCEPLPQEPAPDCGGCGDITVVDTQRLMLALRAFQEHMNFTDAMRDFQTLSCLVHKHNFVDQFVGNDSSLCDQPPMECFLDDDCNPCPFANETFVCTGNLCAQNVTEPIIP